MNKDRIVYLDAIAGLLIIVMLGLHFGVISAEIHSIGSFFSFYMAWFFFKSGMMHKEIKRVSKTFFVKLIQRLLVPFLIFTLFGLILETARYIQESQNPMFAVRSCIAQMVTMGFAWCNAPLWFLLSLFFARITSAYLDSKLWWLWIGIFLGIAIIHHNMTFERYNYIGNASLAIVYYYAGWKLKEAHYNNIIVALCAGVYLIVFFIFPVFLDIRSNTTGYGYYLVAVSSAIPGIILINYFFTSYKIPFLKQLCFMGENAMIFLVLHWPIMLLLRRLMGGVLSPTELTYVVALATIILCLFICLVLNRRPRLGWIIGR